MNTKIWLAELSFRSSRVWWYFLVHILKIKKVWIDSIKRDSKVVKNFIRLYLRKSSCVRVENFDSHYTPFKQKKSHSIIFTRSKVLVYTNFADGQTDGQTDGRLFFQISPPFWPKLVYLYFQIGNRYKKNSKQKYL